MSVIEILTPAADGEGLALGPESVRTALRSEYFI